ncbi:chemotaxis protein CheA [Desulfonatronum thioautotrophicum]|uniref:chemotaxis protein CheA n=1 Tax=Desulfonatronum thioautotrophicum TaxID=617001 RepID=UPI0005EBBE18|nr:chemotaxis protein CheA [Desulfonatronum thioautotrophicum]
MSGKMHLFIEECREMLAELESALLELEDEPDNIDGIHRIFRALHTIKGSSAMLGLEDIRELTNDLETLYDRIRAGKTPCSQAIITLSFRYKDLVHDYLRAPEQGLALDQTQLILADLEQVLKEETQTERSELHAPNQDHLPRKSMPQSDPAFAAPPVQTDSLACSPCHQNGSGNSGDDFKLYHLRYQPLQKPLDTVDPQIFLDQILALGPCDILAAVQDIPALENLDPARCWTGWDVILRTVVDAETIRDTFLFLDDPGDVVRFQEITTAEAEELRQAHRQETSDLLVAASRSITSSQIDGVKPSELVEQNTLTTPQWPKPETAPPSTDRAFQATASAPSAPPGSLTAPLSDAQQSPPAGPGSGKNEEIASIRVSAPKLDDMVDLVGQLVIAQARLKQIESELHNPLLTSVSEEIERLGNDLRERTLSLRMVPIGTTFNRFRRLVRDLSSELGKEIELKTHGAETELDKTVIEKLSDPLVHILRNSIDHGIEVAELRRERGKAAKGTITLSAMQSAGQVRIIIADDGGGIDPDRIYTKAVERGLAKSDTRPSDREVLQLIFHPGFSTAETVTAVSGRGVGMDVVKRSLESLKGTVEIDSRPGNGTTISIGLPLTLAIIEGLLVSMDEEYYVIPLSDVQECVEIQRGPTERDRIARAYDVRGELLPCLILRNWYKLHTQGPEIEQVVVVQAGTRRVGLVVDTIIGQLQTVIKGLGRVFSGMQGLSGATIMGNGALALILDVPSLVTELENQEASGVSKVSRIS